MRTPHHGTTNDKTYKDKISNTDNICVEAIAKNGRYNDLVNVAKYISISHMAMNLFHFA
jgi:hypothetical protein